uniref:Uncharacterized protein n=1 Tax=Anguilla anguilla TaxID=7936 RepID=A0A0E9PNE7_ANGAN
MYTGRCMYLTYNGRHPNSTTRSRHNIRTDQRTQDHTVSLT